MMKLFYELVQVALGQKTELSHVLTEDEWTDIFALSKKQSLLGLLLLALERLSVNGQKPPRALLYKWIAQCEKIKAQNRFINTHCGAVTKWFEDAGFRTCVLKGQGNALMYPEPLLRIPGDIDIWVEGTHEKIRKFVLSAFPNAHDGVMHIKVPFAKNVLVEVHYFPRSSFVPKYDRRLQAWFRENADAQFRNKVALENNNPTSEVCVPTAKFNAVQQMSHIMGHFFVEGIGLRQFVDYFYVLKKLHDEECSENFEKLFDYLGLLKFARGVMWVEKYVLGIDDDCLLTTPDAKIGKSILKVIEEGGNFGQHDQRHTLRKKGFFTRGVVDCFKLIKLFYYFPEDALWAMVKKVKKLMWRAEHLSTH